MPGHACLKAVVGVAIDGLGLHDLLECHQSEVALEEARIPPTEHIANSRLTEPESVGRSWMMGSASGEKDGIRGAPHGAP